jgi:hypothetical protein
VAGPNGFQNRGHAARGLPDIIFFSAWQKMIKGFATDLRLY